VEEASVETEDLAAAGATPLGLTVRTEGDNDGYTIVKRLRELSGGELAWADGMVYPLLHRLSRLGYVSADWRPASTGHRRRYYTITPTGRGACEESRPRSVRTRCRSGGVWGALLVGVAGSPQGAGA
jgi:PadR family transcriptional regulator PadR